MEVFEKGSKESADRERAGEKAAVRNLGNIDAADAMRDLLQ
jgi:hypothetical protein